MQSNWILLLLLCCWYFLVVRMKWKLYDSFLLCILLFGYAIVQFYVELNTSFHKGYFHLTVIWLLFKFYEYYEISFRHLIQSRSNLSCTVQRKKTTTKELSPWSNLGNKINLINSLDDHNCNLTQGTHLKRIERRKSTDKKICSYVDC